MIVKMTTNKMATLWTVLLHVVVVTCESNINETALRATLRIGYDKFVRPSVITDVELFYSIRTLQSLDISEQQMTLTGWMSMFWLDSRLTWNNSTYEIDSIEINWGWRPEFFVSNSVTDVKMKGIDDADTKLRVTSSGNVRWNQLLVSVTSCIVDTTNFPFDSQTCDIEILFWGLTTSEVNLTNYLDTAKLKAYVDNGEWVFQSSSTVVYSRSLELCCPITTHPAFIAALTFSRRRSFYVMNLIFPTVLVSLCMVLTFLLPTESGERLGYTLTITLAYTVQLSVTSQMMPASSTNVPHFALYLLVILVLNSLVIIHVVLHVRLFYKEGNVNGCFKVFYKKLNRVVFLLYCSGERSSAPIRNNKISNGSMVDILTDVNEKPSLDVEDGKTDDDNRPIKRNVESDEEVTWSMISIMLDRIALYLYIVVITIVNGALLISIM